MKYRSILWASLFLLLLSCSHKEKNVTRHSYNLGDVPSISINCQPDSLDVTIDIEEMFIVNNDLITISDLDTFSFHRFSLADLTLTDRFGRQGEGPDELTMPNILRPTLSHDLYLIDNGRGRMYNASNVGDTIFFAGNDLMNQPTEIKWPHIGYYRLNGTGRELCLYDVMKKAVTDSISISDILPDLKNSSFLWGTNSQKVVLTFFWSDDILIFDVNSGKLTNGIVVSSNNIPENGVAFSSVQCLDNCFLTLSNSEVDFSDENNITGTSKIIVFNYDGVPQMVIDTDKIGGRMVYDRNQNRILMTGVTEECIYTLKLPDALLSSLS